jgi:hypothetical protein
MDLNEITLSRMEHKERVRKAEKAYWVENSGSRERPAGLLGNLLALISRF